MISVGKEIIPLVAASERGEAQTNRVRPVGVVGPDIVKLPITRLGERPWNGRPERVRAPYTKSAVTSGGYLSTTGHVKPRGNLGRPPPKARYL